MPTWAKVLLSIWAALIVMYVVSAAFGAVIFPFKTTHDDFAPAGYHVIMTSHGYCQAVIEYFVIALAHESNTHGWQIWYTTDRIVALHFTFRGNDRDGADADVLFIGTITADGKIMITKEEPFDLKIHAGPCQFLAEKEA